jgi:hypothetical protein
MIFCANDDRILSALWTDELNDDKIQELQRLHNRPLNTSSTHSTHQPHANQTITQFGSCSLPMITKFANRNATIDDKTHRLRQVFLQQQARQVIKHSIVELN